MTYLQRVIKLSNHYPLLEIAKVVLGTLTSALILQWLPSTALALGVGVPSASQASSIDSTRLSAPTNHTAKKYACTGATTVDTVNVTQVPVPCGLPYDQKNYACPVGQVIVGTGSADKGYATYQYTNCQSAYSGCSGSTYQNDVTFISPPARAGMMVCPSQVSCSSGCTWTRVWTANPVCYIACSSQTMASNNCQWQ